MKRLTILLAMAAAILLSPIGSQAADLSGVYKGDGGTVTIKRADSIPIIKAKPEIVKQCKYNAGFAGSGELGTTPGKLAKAKKDFIVTGKTMPDAYIVSFDMGKNPDCPLKWKDMVARFDSRFKVLEHVDISHEYFTFQVSDDPRWTGIHLDIPMGKVREMGGKCMAGQDFFKMKR